MASPDLSGAIEKIKRANKHIDDLDGECIAFLATDPCTLRPQYNAEADTTDYVVEELKDVPLTLSLIAGDAAHNLRSALDHLVCSLVRFAGNSPDRNTGFPILKSGEKYEVDAARKVNGTSSAHQDRIRDTKPYQGGNDDLWGLHRLDIIDKHDLLITHTQCVVGLSHHVSDAMLRLLTGSDAYGTSTEERTFTTPFKSTLLIPKPGDIIMRTIHKAEENDYLQPVYEIAFGKAAVFEGRPIIETLKKLSSLVEGIVLSFA